MHSAQYAVQDTTSLICRSFSVSTRSSLIHSLTLPPSIPPTNFTMDTFEDENPFESEDQVLSETSSTSRVDISEPNSPSAKIARALSQSPPINKSFPLQRQATTPTAADKTYFCCSRDRWLHSGDEFEIRVSHYSACLH